MVEKETIMLNKFFQNTRKPQGLGGRIMLSAMNMGHSSVSGWGLKHLAVKPGDIILDIGCGGVIAIIIYIIAYKNEYKKTYGAAYAESEKIRLELAEHTMNHVVPQMLGDIVVVIIACLLLGIYDWRMALALFIALPLAFGLIFFPRRVQEYLEGIKAVKAFGLSGEKPKALERSLRDMKKESIKREGIAAPFDCACIYDFASRNRTGNTYWRNAPHRRRD
jgi:hypothetical protein